MDIKPLLNKKLRVSRKLYLLRYSVFLNLNDLFNADSQRQFRDEFIGNRATGRGK